MPLHTVLIGALLQPDPPRPNEAIRAKLLVAAKSALWRSASQTVGQNNSDLWQNNKSTKPWQ
jgi:hypothetical protein